MSILQPLSSRNTRLFALYGASIYRITICDFLYLVLFLQCLNHQFSGFIVQHFNHPLASILHRLSRGCAIFRNCYKLGGVDIRTLPLAECTKRIAYVSQDNCLFDLSVIDNIRMGRKGATDAEVIDAAKKCGCHEFIIGLENGYQTVCGASGGHLSGGERQRISIARAMLKDAPIVILDEATASFFYTQLCA